MKEGQMYQIQDGAERLEKFLVRTQQAGYAVASLSKALIEIDLSKSCDHDLLSLTNTDAGHIWDAIILLGRQVAHETVEISKKFGLEEPR